MGEVDCREWWHGEFEMDAWGKSARTLFPESRSTGLPRPVLASRSLNTPFPAQSYAAYSFPGFSTALQSLFLDRYPHKLALIETAKRCASPTF